MIFELADDFAAAVAAMPADHPRRRTLALLEEAVRRDIHFIDRRPTALFQCLWNTCWWYDCPEGAGHYRERAGISPSPLGEPGVHQRLERWRAAKEESTPGFPWIRSLRPPPLAQGGPQLAVLRGHEGDVTSVAFSPDGHRIASGSADDTVRIWDAVTGALLMVLRGHTFAVTSVAFSPAGQHLASGSGDGTVRVWEVDSGSQLMVVDHPRGVTSVAFSPDGRQIASASWDKSIRVWDAATGALSTALQGNGATVWSVAFLPDGRRLACGSGDQVFAGETLDNSVRIWDVSGGDELAVFSGHEETVHFVTSSPDGRRIASGSDDKTVRVWDSGSGTELAVLRGHESGVRGVAISPDGRRLASASYDRTIRLWDAESGDELTVFRGHENEVQSVAFSPDGRRLVSGSRDKTIRIWDTQRTAVQSVLHDHESSVVSTAFSPCGGRVASGSLDGTVRIWDVGSGRETHAMDGHSESVNAVAFSPSGDRLASGSSDATVRIWDAETAGELAVLDDMTGRPAGFFGRVLDIVRGAWTSRRQSGRVSSVAFSPDGQRIAAGAADLTVVVWDVNTSRRLALLRGGPHRPTDAADLPLDSREDAIEHVASLLIARTREIVSVAFSPDGTKITGIAGDRTHCMWDVQSRRLLEMNEGSGRLLDEVSSDAAAIAVGSVRSPFFLVTNNLEARVEVHPNGPPVAWFTAVLRDVATSSVGHAWAGAVAEHLYLITLEGEGE